MNCIYCNDELTDGNWYPSWKENRTYICKKCHNIDVNKYHWKEIIVGNWFWNQGEYFLCRECNMDLNDENWHPSLRNRNSKICKLCVSILSKDYKNEEKRIVMNHYSNGNMKCGCCEEDDYNSLTIDHINDDGAEHKRNTGITSGSQMYNWLIKNNFPYGFQVLCMNCNCVKEWFGDIEYRRGKYL